MWRCSCSAQERQVINQACARKTPEELAESTLRFTHLPRDFMLVRRVPETAFRYLVVCVPGRRDGLLATVGLGIAVAFIYSGARAARMFLCSA
jgi:hypothetical protein